jgi:DnaK suppressor protein
MEQQKLEKIKQRLLERKQEFEQELARMYKEKVTDDQVQDPGDQAVSSIMQLLQSSMQDTRLEEYRRIINALQMIDEGTYGICIDCGGPISEKRLLLFPNATRCLACQEAYEDNKL